MVILLYKIKTPKMSFEELHQVLNIATHDCSEQMYNYGYACGLNNSINFSQIKEVFSNLSLSKPLEADYMTKIIDGFRLGSDFDTNVFFG